MKYNVPVTRISYAHLIFVVHADSEKEAIEKALDMAGDHRFSEKSSEYEADSAVLLDEAPEVKTVIHMEPYTAGRHEAFWYYGKHIATVTLGDITLYVESSGEHSVTFVDDEESLEGDFAVNKAALLGYTDTDIREEDRMVFQANNWFRIIAEDDETGESEVIAHTYLEAIALAKETIMELHEKD